MLRVNVFLSTQQLINQWTLVELVVAWTYRAWVLADCHNNHLWFEVIYGWNYKFWHRQLVALVSSPIRQRYIYVETLALARANFICQPSLRMRGPPRAMVHVQGDRQHVVSRVKTLRRAVSIMNIYIEDNHSLATLVKQNLSRSY